jgi:hypothetical protein
LWKTGRHTCIVKPARLTQSEHPAAWVPVIPLLAFFASVFRARIPCGALPVRSVHLFYCMAEDSAIEAYKSNGLCLFEKAIALWFRLCREWHG